MNKTTSHPYDSVSKASQVLSASPVGLIVLVYDRLIEKLERVSQELKEGEQGLAGVDQCLDLLEIGLVSALDLNRGGEIAKNLLDIYRWAMSQISIGVAQGDKARIDSVVATITLLRDAWEEIKQYEAKGVRSPLSIMNYTL